MNSMFLRKRWCRAKLLILVLIFILWSFVGCESNSRSVVDPAEYYNVAAVAYNSGDYELALRGYTQAIETDSSFELAYVGRGITYIQLAEYARAIQDFTMAIALNPDAHYAYQNRGDVYALIGDWEEAIADYSTAIVLHPDNLKAYLGRASAYQFAEQFDRAVRDATEAIEIDEAIAMGYAIRGNTYADMERWEEAVEDYNQALRLLNPMNTPLDVDTTTTGVPIANLSEAIADLEQYAQIVTDSSVQLQITDLLERLNNEQSSSR